MNLKDIANFICVAEKHNITKAAESLFLSQQALSKSISRLETELGVPLLVRSRGGVSLTESGRHFLNFATVSTAQFHNMKDSLRRIGSEQGDIVTFGYATGMLSHFLPKFLSAFMQAHLGSVFMTHSYQDDAYHRISTVPECSICLVSSVPENGPYRVEHAFHCPLCIMMAADNPLAEKEELRWDDLTAVPMIRLNAENDSIDGIKHQLYLHGIVPRFVLNAAEHELSDELMLHFRAVSLYGGPQRHIPEGLVTRRLAGLDMQMHYYLCVERDHICNETEKEFIAALVDALK